MSPFFPSPGQIQRQLAHLDDLIMFHELIGEPTQRMFEIQGLTAEDIEKVLSRPPRDKS